MNERIKELAEQASLEFDDDLALEPEPVYYITQKELEKFAELIIKECADIATMNQYQSYTPGHYVLKHFGVEE
jgi:hypothetical protein